MTSIAKIVREILIPAAAVAPLTRYFGVNAFDSIGYASLEQPFLNLLKQSGSNWSNVGSAWWTRNGSGGDTSEEPSLQVDSDGYVTTLAGLTATYVETWMNTNFIADTPVPGTSKLFPADGAAVTYRLQFQGKCTLNIPGASSLSTTTPGVTVAGTQITSTNAWGTVNTVTFSINQHIWLQVKALPDAANYFKAASIVENTYAASYDAGEILHPTFKAHLTNNGAGFVSRVRFMAAQFTNQQDLNVTFTAQVNAGDKTATISSVNNGQGPWSTWPLPTGTYSFVFGSGDVRQVSCTYGQTAVNWSSQAGLTANVPTNNLGCMASAAPFTWATRPLPSNFSWATNKGLPLEVMVAVCNELGIDAWIHVPLTASIVDATYVTNFSQLLHDGTGSNVANSNLAAQTGLGASQVAFVELSNEVSGAWNGGAGYSQGGNVTKLMANQTGLYAANGNNAGYASAEWYGTQVASIADTFATTYGSGPMAARVRIVMACQFATGNGVAFMKQSMNTPNSASRAYAHGIGQNSYVLSFAPYCPLANMATAGTGPADIAHLVGLGTTAAQLTELFSLCYSNVGASGYTYQSLPSRGWVGDALGQSNGVLGMQAGWSSQPWANVPIDCYEMGINMDNRLANGDASHTAWGVLLAAAERDARIGDVYYDSGQVLSWNNPGYLKKLYQYGVVGNQLNLIDPDTKAATWAGWGILESVMQPVNSTPRYQAAVSFKANG